MPNTTIEKQKVHCFQQKVLCLQHVKKVNSEQVIISNINYYEIFQELPRYKV